ATLGVHRHQHTFCPRTQAGLLLSPFRDLWSASGATAGATHKSQTGNQLLDMPALASHFLAMSDRLVPLAASAFIEIRSSVVSFADTASSVLVMVSFCLPDLISGTTFSAANNDLSSSRATRLFVTRPG